MSKSKSQENTRDNSHDDSHNRVIIVGGGWSGLAAAVKLAHHKIPVILLESAKQLGGRARSVHIDELRVDNGQHMLLGAYKSTLELLDLICVKESEAFKRQPLSLQWLNNIGRPVTLNTPNLPAPFHLAWALLSIRGLSLRDRFSALRFSQKLQRLNFEIKQDCSVEYLLQTNRQSDALTNAIWEPLCLAALNTQIHEASAQIFLRTLGDSFSHSCHDSDVLLTSRNLGEIFPQPASDYIETHKGSVRLGQRVTGITINKNMINGITFEEDHLDTRIVILATPSTVTKKLIESHTPLQELNSQMEHIEHRPICTVYLQYPENIKLGQLIQGSLNTTTQWVFDRRINGQNGLISVVISGDGEHMEWDNEKLCGIVKEELASHFPKWPLPLSCHVIREKRATFAATVNINQHRPNNQTPVNGLWLAGDYTNNGLPGTLESAVQSGLLCAQQIIHEQEVKQS